VAPALLHLIHFADWERFQRDGSWAPASLTNEGFVHCTGDDALLLRVANSFYRDERGQFMVLSIDPDRLDAPVRWELPPGADPHADTLFPHVYGPIPLSAVVGVRTATRDESGAYTGFAANP
jgi:uncharacterized protein (DUF952 family)